MVQETVICPPPEAQATTPTCTQTKMVKDKRKKKNATCTDQFAADRQALKE